MGRRKIAIEYLADDRVRKAQHNTPTKAQRHSGLCWPSPTTKQYQTSKSSTTTNHFNHTTSTCTKKLPSTSKHHLNHSLARSSHRRLTLSLLVQVTFCKRKGGLFKKADVRAAHHPRLHIDDPVTRLASRHEPLQPTTTSPLL